MNHRDIVPSCHTTTAAYNLQARDLVIDRTQRSSSRRAASKPRKREEINTERAPSKKHKAESLASKMQNKQGRDATVSSNKQFTSYYHARIAKLFFETPHQELYFGSVIGECGNEIQKLWAVQYDDGDLEDWDVNEVELGLETCKQHVQAAVHNLWQVFNISPASTLNNSKGTNRKNQTTSSMTTVFKFYLFLLERQRCWIRRKAHHKQNPECWTNCTIFRNYYFCNNYRELDRGTQFFHAQILQRWERKENYDWREWFEIVLWASYCYRLVNKVESFACQEGETTCLLTATCQGIPSIEEWPQFRSFDNYIIWMDHVRSRPNVFKQVAAATTSLESCFRAIKTELPGCGDFMSWQVLCDILESNGWPEKSVVMDFCVLGKGAKAGILEVFYPNDSSKRPTKQEYLDHARQLVDQQDTIYDELLEQAPDGIQLTFPKWRNRPLTLKEIEHALCEFSKSQRIERALAQGNTPTGQRLRKSRCHLDQEMKCYQHGRHQKCQSSNLRVCDTCNLGYCQSCDDSILQVGDDIAWCCRRCIGLEEFSWDEGLSRLCGYSKCSK